MQQYMEGMDEELFGHGIGAEFARENTTAVLITLQFTFKLYLFIIRTVLLHFMFMIL